MPSKRISKTCTEVDCIHCEGTGLLANSKALFSWKVEVCGGCNGHGTIILEVVTNSRGEEINHVHKYSQFEKKRLP